MLKYTIQRILTFIPMLIAISLLSFVISINAPGDPVETLSKAAGNEGGAEKQSGTAKSVKQKLRKKLGLDLPLFYFSITDMASCDTLYKVQDRNQRENLETLIHQFGNWPAVDNYYKSLLNLQKTQQSIDIKLMCEKDTTLDKNIVNEDFIVLKLQPHDLTGEIGFGMDFYLEYFKFSPQIKVSAGILNLLTKDESVYTTSIQNLYTNGWMLSFTFE